MEFVGSYIGNVASDWVSSTVEGAKTAAAAYGGNLAGDAISYGGSLIESAGRATGSTVAGAFKGYGDWINGHGDRLRGGPASTLPTSGPMATYKAGGAGSLTLKESQSYGPASSASKALTKTASTVATAGSGALRPDAARASRATPANGKGSPAGLPTAKSSTLGYGTPATPVKPNSTFAMKKQHAGAVMKQATPANTGAAGPAASAKTERKPVYPGVSAVQSTQGTTPVTKGPTASRSHSVPGSATNAAGKVKISPSSRPQSKSYAPCRGSRADSVGHVATKGEENSRLRGVAGESNAGVKGYRPGYPTNTGAAKPGGVGLGTIDRNYF